MTDAPTTTANITQLNIIITPNSGQTKIYRRGGSSDPVLTYTNYPALIGSDEFTGALTRALGESVDTYAIYLGTLTAGLNYNVMLSSSIVYFIIAKLGICSVPFN